jgi:hypothetical protein
VLAGGCRSTHRAPFRRRALAEARRAEHAVHRCRRQDGRQVNHRPKEDACHPPRCWTPAVGVHRPQPSRAFTKAEHRVTRVSATQRGDPDPPRQGGKRREVGMDRWAWEQLTPCLQLRATLPIGALFCVLRGPTAGRPWAPAAVRTQLHRAAARTGVRRRFAPHQRLACPSWHWMTSSGTPARTSECRHCARARQAGLGGQSALGVRWLAAAAA